MVTCCIRYRVDRKRRAEFEECGIAGGFANCRDGAGRPVRMIDRGARPLRIIGSVPEATLAEVRARLAVSDGAPARGHVLL